MGKLTIQEVAKVLVEKNNLAQRDANKFATEMFAVILEHLQQGEQMKIKGLGTFKIISVEARESVNVRTGERFVIDSHSKVTFTPDTLMKELVNKPFSQFETVVLNDGVEFEDVSEVEQEPEQEPEEPIAEESQTAVTEADEEEQPVAVEEDHADTLMADVGEPDVQTVEEHHWGRWLLMGLGVLLLMALSAFCGYQYGSRQQVAVVTADTVVVTDTVFVSERKDTAAVTPMPEAESEPAGQPEQEAVAKTEAKPATPTLDPYEAKDDRVRLGAYRIVGTAEEVTVSEGQTFYSICRAHLGSDMQCYVEVYNNLPRDPKIHVGQVLKIPKLQLKKRRRKG